MQASQTCPREAVRRSASRGISYSLNELPEFARDALEVLRQPLEDGVVHVSRVAASYTYPADFCLIADLNMGKARLCENYTALEASRITTFTMPLTVQYTDLYRQCTCSSTAVAKYQKRISGPLLDRIDLHIEVPRLSEEELLQASKGETSAAIRSRVCRARSMQAARFESPILPTDLTDIAEPPHPADAAVDAIACPKRARPIFCNAQMGPKDIRVNLSARAKLLQESVKVKPFVRVSFDGAITEVETAVSQPTSKR